jgi:hypothetical protein
MSAYWHFSDVGRCPPWVSQELPGGYARHRFFCVCQQLQTKPLESLNGIMLPSDVSCVHAGKWSAELVLRRQPKKPSAASKPGNPGYGEQRRDQARNASPHLPLPVFQVCRALATTAGPSTPNWGIGTFSFLDALGRDECQSLPLDDLSIFRTRPFKNPDARFGWCSTCFNLLDPPSH